MELRAYAKILWRRIWIIALVVGIVTIYIAYQYFSTAKTFKTAETYQATISLRIGLPATAHTQSTDEYSRRTEDQAEQFINGPLLEDATFNDEVFQRIENDKNIVEDQFGSKADLGNITAEKLPGAYKATRIHNSVTVTVTWSTQAGAWIIAYALGQVSESSLPRYLNYSVDGPGGQTSSEINNIAAVAKVISPPDKPTVTGGSIVQRKNTTLIIIFLVGLVIAIALAFLIEYLDERIREPREIMHILQLPIYGEVPHAPLPGERRASRSNTA